MPQYLILAQSEVTARALGAWLELLGERGVENPLADSRCILGSEQNIGGLERGLLAYESLVRRIETAVSEGDSPMPLNEVVALVDAVQPSNLNVMQEDGDWNNLVAMLILTFPEIRWVFGVVSGEKDGFPEPWHSLAALLCKPRRDPLFDPSGLRDFVRAKVLHSGGEEGKPDTSDLPRRKKQAAVIDEEQSYALFHAYTAYRFGYRVDEVRSWALMNSLFSKSEGSSEANPSSHGFDLLLEDVNLNFPDKPGSVHLSTFPQFQHETEGQQGREHHCPLLGYAQKDNKKEDSSFRIIVSSGHSGADAEKMQVNENYVQRNKPVGHGFVLKPVGGMFDLWQKAGLFDRLIPDEHSEMSGQRRGSAPGFFWPPKLTDDGSETGGHSAPGKLMILAQHLVRRAEALRASANTVEDCLHGAVLATDALELLRYQTPTLALQALELKHEFEVKAEVAFLGVGHHFDLKLRFKELKEEVHVAARFFQRGRRRAAELDALVSIGNRLMLVFRDDGHFDEEQICLAQIRSWHRQLRLGQSRGPLDFLGQLAVGYAEFLLAKPGRFIAALVIWYLVMFGGWLIVEPSLIPKADHPLIDAASRAFNAFYVTNPQIASSPVELALNAAACLLGLFHLGVFISYLYSAVTRK